MAIAKEDILEAVGSMSVLELNELVKAFEREVWRVGCCCRSGRPGSGWRCSRSG